MVFFGSGSIIGSWLGGKLSDKIGFYKIMIFSLFTTGILLFCIQFITSFVGLCIGMFVLMIIADMFRPAMFVSIGAYAKPETIQLKRNIQNGLSLNTECVNISPG